jgi:hypothetical protein
MAIDAEILEAWREQLNVDATKWFRDAEPIPWRLFRPPPKADSALNRLADRYPTLVAAVKETTSELAAMIDPAVHRDDLKVADAGAKLRRRIADLIDATAKQRESITPRQNDASSEHAVSSSTTDNTEGVVSSVIIRPCPICGAPRTPEDVDHFCEVCCRTSELNQSIRDDEARWRREGKIAELWLAVLEHDTCLKRGDDREAESVMRRLERLNWETIRDRAQRLFGTTDEGERLFGRIRGRLTTNLAERNEFLDRPIGDLLPLLEAELASLSREQAQALASQALPPSPPNEAAELSSELPRYVTLDQMAVVANRSKKTLERWLNRGKLPSPDVEGGGGFPHEWKWENVRAKLQEISGKEMPTHYPTLRK